MKADFLATNTIIMTHKPPVNPTAVPLIHETPPLEDPDPERPSTFVCNSCVVLHPFESKGKGICLRVDHWSPKSNQIYL